MRILREQEFRTRKTKRRQYVAITLESRHIGVGIKPMLEVWKHFYRKGDIRRTLVFRGNARGPADTAYYRAKAALQVSHIALNR